MFGRHNRVVSQVIIAVGSMGSMTVVYKHTKHGRTWTTNLHFYGRTADDGNFYDSRWSGPVRPVCRNSFHWLHSFGNSQIFSNFPSVIFPTNLILAHVYLSLLIVQKTNRHQNAVNNNYNLMLQTERVLQFILYVYHTKTKTNYIFVLPSTIPARSK